jgi:hypothetical protein
MEKYRNSKIASKLLKIDLIMLVLIPISTSLLFYFRPIMNLERFAFGIISSIPFLFPPIAILIFHVYLIVSNKCFAKNKAGIALDIFVVLLHLCCISFVSSIIYFITAFVCIGEL